MSPLRTRREKIHRRLRLSSAIAGLSAGFVFILRPAWGGARANSRSRIGNHDRFFRAPRQKDHCLRSFGTFSLHLPPAHPRTLAVRTLQRQEIEEGETQIGKAEQRRPNPGEQQKQVGQRTRQGNQRVLPRGSSFADRKSTRLNSS